MACLQPLPRCHSSDSFDIRGRNGNNRKPIRLNSFSRLDEPCEVQTIESGMLPQLIDLPNFLLKNCDMILPIGTRYVRN